MRIFILFLFVFCLAGMVAQAQAQAQQACPGQCEADWRPVCGLSAKKGMRTFGNVCKMSDWNRCNKGDYQVSKFSIC